MSEVEFPPGTALLQNELRRLGVAESEVVKMRVVFDTTPLRAWNPAGHCAPTEFAYDLPELPPRDPFDPERDWRTKVFATGYPEGWCKPA